LVKFINLIELLNNNEFFKGLAESELKEISPAFSEKQFQRDEIVILEGDQETNLFFVKTGVLKVYKTSSEGKEQILYLIRPGDTINDIAFFNGGISPVSVQALSQVVLLSINRTNILYYIKKYCQLALNIINIQATRLRRMMLLIEDLSFRPVIDRVIRIILDSLNGGTDGVPRLTQREIASMAGTAREMVSRSIKTLEEDGSIQIDGHRIIIKDRKALEARLVE
jgi:CRP/FNR family transcriptional regulator